MVVLSISKTLQIAVLLLGALSRADNSVPPKIDLLCGMVGNGPVTPNNIPVPTVPGNIGTAGLRARYVGPTIRLNRADGGANPIGTWSNFRGNLGNVNLLATKWESKTFGFVPFTDVSSGNGGARRFVYKVHYHDATFYYYGQPTRTCEIPYRNGENPNLIEVQEIVKMNGNALIVFRALPESGGANRIFQAYSDGLSAAINRSYRKEAYEDEYGLLRAFSHICSFDFHEDAFPSFLFDFIFDKCKFHPSKVGTGIY